MHSNARHAIAALLHVIKYVIGGRTWQCSCIVMLGCPKVYCLRSPWSPVWEFQWNIIHQLQFAPRKGRSLIDHHLEDQH